MPEPIDHLKQRGALESLLKSVPGFRGYLEREHRRDSDRLQRMSLADHLQHSKGGLDRLARVLVDSGAIDELPRLDRLRAQIDRLIGRMRSAMPGYSGMFDLVRVDAQVLERVYEYDLGLQSDVEALGGELRAIVEASADPRQALNKVAATIDEIGKLWDARETILRGIES